MRREHAVIYLFVLTSLLSSNALAAAQPPGTVTRPSRQYTIEQFLATTAANRWTTGTPSPRARAMRAAVGSGLATQDSADAPEETAAAPVPTRPSAGADASGSWAG